MSLETHLPPSVHWNVVLEKTKHRPVNMINVCNNQFESIANRRWSGSSIRSQSSVPSTFSFRSQSTIRNTTANVQSEREETDAIIYRTVDQTLQSNITPLNLSSTGLVSIPLTTAPFSTSGASCKVTSRVNKSAITGTSSASVGTSEGMITSDRSHSHQQPLQTANQQQSAVCHSDSLLNSDGNCSTFC